jgi:nucleoporin GLE1
MFPSTIISDYHTAHNILQCKEILSLCQLNSEYLYMAVLYSLSKAILLQAEVEVTAEKRSAIPLARATSFFVQKLDRFPLIFYMKLIQRTGGWPIPVKPPPEEGIEYSKLIGFREDEGLSEYIPRVAGLMRVYFQILITPTDQPVDRFFRPTVYWTYFARLMCDRGLLESGPVGPELLASKYSPPQQLLLLVDPHCAFSAALDVGGLQAREIFGKQWHKLMELLYSGLTEANPKNPIGGTTPEGTAARTRALLEVEKVMSS